MIKLGLLGYPLGHSLSKVMQEAALKDLNLNGSYELMETDPEDFIQTVKDLRNSDFTGFNITIPFKVTMGLLIDDYDEMANLAGCVNTVKIMPDKTLKGFNTDIYGFQSAFTDEQKEQIKGQKAAIIGTGGAARAAAIGLSMLGIKSIDLYTRNIVNASDMANFLRTQFPQVSFNLKQVQSMSDLSDISVLVNATPIGMRGKAMDLTPVGAETLSTLPKKAIVYDIIYNPRKTILLKTASQLGYSTIDGCEMLLHQGAKAFEIWIGKKPSVSVMKIALLDSLAQ